MEGDGGFRAQDFRVDLGAAGGFSVVGESALVLVRSSSRIVRVEDRRRVGRGKEEGGMIKEKRFTEAREIIFVIHGGACDARRVSIFE